MKNRRTDRRTNEGRKEGQKVMSKVHLSILFRCAKRGKRKNLLTLLLSKLFVWPYWNKKKTQNLLHNNFQKIIIQVMTRCYWTIVINFIYKKFIKHINDTYLTNRSHYFVFPEHKHTAFLHRQLFYSLSMYYGIVLSN